MLCQKNDTYKILVEYLKKICGGSTYTFWVNFDSDLDSVSSFNPYAGSNRKRSQVNLYGILSIILSFINPAVSFLYLLMS